MIILEWCFAHSWMTFFISVILIACFNSVISDIVNHTHHQQDGGNEPEEGIMEAIFSSPDLDFTIYRDDKNNWIIKDNEDNNEK